MHFVSPPLFHGLCPLLLFPSLERAGCCLRVPWETVDRPALRHLLRVTSDFGCFFAYHFFLPQDLFSLPLVSAVLLVGAPLFFRPALPSFSPRGIRIVGVVTCLRIAGNFWSRRAGRLCSLPRLPPQWNNWAPRFFPASYGAYPVCVSSGHGYWVRALSASLLCPFH